jgi:DNA-binding response OmpR family regulator
VENALEAMRNGAYDFIQKPLNIDEVSALVDKAMEKNELKGLVALYESSNAIFSSLRLEKLFPIMISLLRDVTYSKDVSIFATQIVQSIRNIRLYEKLEVKVAEFEHALADLDKTKKEINSLQKDVNRCL